MTYQKVFVTLWLAAITFTIGCVGSGRTKTPSWSSLSSGMSDMHRSWKRLTSQKQSVEPPVWKWASGIPDSAPRAEMFAAVVPSPAIARFLPQAAHAPIMLASGGVNPQLPEGYLIRNIGGQQVRSVGDLHRALDRVAPANGLVQVDLLPVTDAAEDGERAVEVDVPTLFAVCHSVADQQPVMRSAEDGNSWLIIRSGGVRAKLMVRLEKNHDLVQVVLSLTNCWGSESVLPVELQAAVEGVPLQCLTVAETLESLYGAKPLERNSGDAASHSFAAVSERADYRIPVNFERLKERMASGRQTVRPAVASVPGASYPGPAVLADARAISGFLLQRQPLDSGDAEHIGWVMFSGAGVQNHGRLDVTLDLGQGPQSFRFTFPREP